MLDEDLEDAMNDAVDEIMNCYTNSALIELEKNYNFDVPHPYVGYALGKRFINLGNKERAFKHFIHTVLVARNEFWIKTSYSDAIGQSLYYLLTEYEYGEKNNDILSKVFAMAYIYLSICVESMREESYDSNKTRGKLIDTFNHECSEKILREYYYKGNICKEVLFLGDYYFASVGLKKDGFFDNASTYLKLANQAMETMKSLPQYQLMKNFSLPHFVKVSNDNSTYFYQNLFKQYNLFELNDIEITVLNHTQKQVWN